LNKKINNLKIIKMSDDSAPNKINQESQESKSSSPRNNNNNINQDT
jgi:hypothetical protein